MGKTKRKENIERQVQRAITKSNNIDTNNKPVILQILRVNNTNKKIKVVDELLESLR